MYILNVYVFVYCICIVIIYSIYALIIYISLFNTVAYLGYGRPGRCPAWTPLLKRVGTKNCNLI